MIHLTPNLPEVVAEVRELFERYERALIDKDVRSSRSAAISPPSTSSSRCAVAS